MNEKVSRYLVIEPRELPEIRALIDFLYSAQHDVDTDGDSDNPKSRTWTCLTIISRERPKERVDVDSVSDQPFVLAVRSSLPWLAARMTYALAATTGGRVTDAGGASLDLKTLWSRLGRFDLDAAMRRFASRSGAERY